MNSENQELFSFIRALNLDGFNKYYYQNIKSFDSIKYEDETPTNKNIKEDLIKILQENKNVDILF